MASQVDPPSDESQTTESTQAEDIDRTDAHLLMALESAEKDGARYHLREALQLHLAERQTF